MNKFMYIVSVVLLFACMLTACTNGELNINEDQVQANQEESKQDHVVSFMDVEVAREQLKTAIWGSIGWSMWHPNESEYIYAAFGYHLIRYNISNNEIDRAIAFKQSSQHFIDHNLQFSLNGKQGLLADTYLIDFENMKISLLSEAEIRNEIEKIEFDGDNHNLDALAYSIEYKAEENQFIVSADQETSGREIVSLRGAELNGDRPFVGIRSKVVGTLIPHDQDGFGLGYYKFVLIDVEKDEIIQEYPINMNS
ncbi:hypothetical protein [Marinicrinis sediminis]|uniref:Lipoprotein n=1 Tax=Marinicrinis sediminis TaxID=1652465 RepID=A0ABW5RAP2_9BACL